MEGLVNYSSEDEQDDCNYQKAAERGSPRNRGVTSTSAVSAGGRGSRSGSSNGDSRRSPHLNVTGGGNGSNSSGRSSFRGEEGTNRYKSNPSYAGNRSNSSYYSRDNRDTKDPKDSRGFRDFGNSNRFNDYKVNERSHPKDNKRDRETYHNNRRGGASRDDDRSNRNPSSFSSPHPRGRYGNSSNSRYSFDRNRPHHHQQRSNDERSSTDHYARSERSTVRHRRRSESHSRSRSHSPQNVTNMKRTSTRNDTIKSQHSRSYRAHHDDSHSRSRSRSHSRERCTAAQPLEQARLCALEMEHKLTADDDATDTAATAITESKPQQELPLRHSAPLLALPLSDTAPKQPNVIAVATPSSSLNNGEPAVIQLPSYYNPSVINPNKYAEQVQKRKLLWGAKKVEDTAAKWNNAQFSQDSDGKVASKFMRLMGIKGAAGTAPSAKADGNEGDAANKVSSGIPAPDVKSREVMFSNMEQQYEVARQTTHTMRGVGLGFSSQSRPF